jgi:Zn-finger nucleic acid-binding protein
MLRCGHCFDLNFPDDLHCRGCGQEVGLAVAAADSDLTCADCKLPLTTFKAGTGQLQACARCGGQMVTHGLLRALLEQREVLGAAVPTPGQAPRGNPLKDPVRYRPCPSCQLLMNRKNFGGASGIIVDVCVRHGTFFDAGELPRVLEYVRRGGLAHARAALENKAPSVAGSGPALSAGSGHSSGMLDEWVDLLSFVVDVLRKP